MALWIGFLTFYPWQKLLVIDMPAAGTAHATRAARFCFNEPTQDLLLLGSSLIIGPSIAANRNGLNTKKDLQDSELDQLLNCDCYRKEFLRASGQNLNMAMLGVPAAMMSDQYLITKALIESGHIPKLIVITFGAREFIDNSISFRIDDTPVSRVFTALLSQRVNLFNSAPEKLSATLLYQKKFADLLRLQLRRQAIKFICSTMAREESLWYASSKKTAGLAVEKEQIARDNEEHDFTKSSKQYLKESLADYNKRYNPFDKKAYLKQVTSLENILKTCSAHNVAVVLVAMPLTKENLQLLAPTVKKELDDWLRSLSAKYKVSLIDMNDNDKFHYESSLFYDSIHLTKQGCEKFIGDLTAKLMEDESWKRIFHSK